MLVGHLEGDGIELWEEAEILVVWAVLGLDIKQVQLVSAPVRERSNAGCEVEDDGEWLSGEVFLDQNGSFYQRYPKDKKVNWEVDCACWNF